jgi:hypothetical protein
MSYQLQVQADAPFSYWKLDGSGPIYDDSAGSLRQADLVGTAVLSSALVAGSGNSLVLSNTNRIEMDDPVFNKGYEQRAFTLEAWVKPIDVTGPVSVMSHSSTYDGLVITEDEILFTTKYVGFGECVASFRYTVNKSYHVVGVHNNGRNSLYVDGELVAETDLTEDQQSAVYDFLTTDLIAGQSGTASTISFDAPAIYVRTLPAEVIASHYSSGINVPLSETIASYNQGTFWDFSDESRNVAMTKTWDVDAEWQEGFITNTVVANNTIVPFYSQSESTVIVDGLPTIEFTNTSIAGTWQSSIELSGVPEATLAEGRLIWAGEGDFTVEYSLDGTIWNPPANLATESLTNTDSIDIRVSFTGGVVDDPSYVDYINIVVYTDKDFIGSLDNRFASFTGVGVTSQNYYEPIEYADFNGIEITTGEITITVDASFNGEEETPDQLFITGFDLWTKAAAGNIVTAGGNTITRTGDTIVFSGFDAVTVNGEIVTSGSTVFGNDDWMHIGAVLTTPLNPTIIVGDDGSSIAQFSALYGEIDGTGMQQIYAAYLGLPGVVVEDSSIVTISQPAEPTKLYSNIWGITPAG